MRRERKNRKRSVGPVKMKRYRREFFKGSSLLLESGTVLTGLVSVDPSYKLTGRKRIQDIDCD